MLPSEVLKRRPDELYLDLVLTYPQEEAARPPRARDAGDTAIQELLGVLRAKHHG
jgi:hypothetical protein